MSVFTTNGRREAALLPFEHQAADLFTVHFNPTSLTHHTTLTQTTRPQLYRSETIARAPGCSIEGHHTDPLQLQMDNLDKVPLVALDHNHYPCTTDIGSLKPITIADLKVETHHRGSVLHVRRTSAVSQTWGRLHAVVQDETGEACALTSWHHMRDVPADEFLPENCVIAVKEPYLSLDFRSHNPRADLRTTGALVIRIDRPTDLVVLPTSSSLIPTSFRTETPPPTALACKEKGNAAFRANRFLEAQRWLVNSSPRCLKATTDRHIAIPKDCTLSRQPRTVLPCTQISCAIVHKSISSCHSSRTPCQMHLPP